MAHPDLLRISLDDQEALDRTYNDIVPTREDAFKVAAEHTETFTLRNDRRFRSVVLPSEDPDGSVVFVPAEFMHGRNHAGGIVRALGIQALNTHSTVVYMPNDRLRLGHSFTNLTMKEKWELLTDDNFDPYVERFNAVLDQLPRDSRDAYDAPTVVVGLSQGGTVGVAYASHPETRATGMSVIEAPNVADRPLRTLELAKAFFSSGGELKNVIARNYAGVDGNTPIEQELVDELGLKGLGRYAVGGLRFGNLALAPSMAKATLQPQLEKALDRGTAVLHAWAIGDDVSPQEVNAAIAAALEGRPLYEAYEFEGDHSLTNYNLVVAALARRALILPFLKQSDAHATMS